MHRYPSACYTISKGVVIQAAPFSAIYTYVQIINLKGNECILAAVVLLAMLLLTWLSSRRMSMPIRKVLDQMDEVQSGNLNVSVPVNGEDELSDLSRGFNHMTEALKEHIEKSYVASLKQKEAELDALRMQIHPTVWEKDASLF